MELEIVDRYTGMSGVPAPWRACATCQAMGVTPDDEPCPACLGSRQRPLQRSLRDLPWRIWKMFAFAWREVVHAEFLAGHPHLSPERMRSRRIALRAMLADFW